MEHARYEIIDSTTNSMQNELKANGRANTLLYLFCDVYIFCSISYLAFVEAPRRTESALCIRDDGCLQRVGAAAGMDKWSTVYPRLHLLAVGAFRAYCLVDCLNQ